MCARVCTRSVSQLCPAFCNPVDCSPPGSSVHGDSPGKNTGVGCHFLLQGIIPTQDLDPCLLRLLHWQTDSLPLFHLGSACLLACLLALFIYLFKYIYFFQLPSWQKYFDDRSLVIGILVKASKLFIFYLV